MNATHSIAVTALMEWLSAFPNSSQSNKALDVFEGYLPDRCEYASDAAAIGEALPRLWCVLPAWVEAHYQALFGSEYGVNVAQQIVLTTILSCHNPGTWLYTNIELAMRLAIKMGAKEYALGCGKRDCERMIGDWLYSGIANEVINEGSTLLKEWRASAGLETQCNVLDRLCRMLCGADDASDSIAKRVGDLWDYLAELCTFDGGPLQGMVTLARSGKYPFSWWGPRLIRETVLRPEGVYHCSGQGTSWSMARIVTPTLRFGYWMLWWKAILILMRASI